MKLRTRIDPNWILILLLTIFAVSPLTYPGFFESNSSFLPAFNAAHPSEAPNWAGIAGMVRGEGFLPYVLIWPFYRLTGSGMVAIKWGYGLAFLLGALGIYVWARRWLGAKGGVLSATVYTYLPWHLSTVYIRGAYAETWLWALWPWILWAIDHLAGRNLRSMSGGVFASLALAAATVWVQPGLATLALPLLIGYGIIVSTRRSWHWLALVQILGLLALFFLFATSTKLETQVPFGDQFLHPFQLLSASWGSGQSYQLGVAAVGLSIAAMALYVGKRDMPQGGSDTSSSPASVRPPAFWFWVCSLLVLVLLCLPILAWFWQFTGLDDLLTYPWQLLGLSGLPLAFLAGSVIRLDWRLSELPAWAGVIALVVLASYPYLEPRYTQVDPGPEPVAMFQPVEAGTPQILLLDAKVGRPAELGDTQALTATLTWQAVEPVAQDYTAFVHVLAADGAKIAQRDTWPCDGECPTGSWQPGEVIVDHYQLNWGQDAEAPSAQPTRLALGLYLVESGDRAFVVGREDRTVFFDVP